MTCITAQNTGPCPCGLPDFPVVVCNPANQPAIEYRIGDYLAFRDRLLRPLPDETQLSNWRPGAQGDLAVQMVEWWAYLSDVLTFYNERIANEAYLRTAIEPESVNHLVQILGYRPRPALGARTTLAGLVSVGARTPVALPPGLQVQSKPGPGAAPQVFELDKPSQLTRPDLIPAVVVAKTRSLLASPGTPAGPNTLWLAGKVSGIKAGDSFLLINAQALGPAPAIADYAWISVIGAADATGPLGDAMTAVSFTPVCSTLAADAGAANYVLLKSAQSSPLWSFPTSSASLTVSRPLIAFQPGHTSVTAPLSTTAVHLAGLARPMTGGSLFLLDAPGAAGLAPTPRIVRSYSEQFWYANCGAAAAAGDLPASNTPPPVGIPISVVTANGVPDTWAEAANTASIIVRYGFTRVGELAPVLTADDVAYPGGGTDLAPSDHADRFPQDEVTVLVEDAAGTGALGALTPSTGGSTLSFPPAAPAVRLASPINVLFNLLPFSRGKTVPMEVLGSGAPIVAGQSFALKNSPVTYFADPASISGENFSSTVQVAVNNVLWREVRSFYGQPPNAQVYVLSEDDAGQTHVTFGDGAHGALLPTGTNNVVAAYRYGAGAAVPGAETLTVIQTPQPGLKSLRNPLTPTGGGDPDNSKRLRSLAPQSVLTFGRAVSKDDYAAMAMTAGADKAIALYVFDPASQRPQVTLWVAGDAGTIATVKQSVTRAAMPGQGLVIRDAKPVEMSLTLDFLCDSELAAPSLKDTLTTALTDPDTGLFGIRAMGIGQVVYESQIEAACLAVQGIQAVRNVDFAKASSRSSVSTGLLLRRRFAPGLSSALGCSGRRQDPGSGGYFVLKTLVLHPSPTGVA